MIVTLLAVACLLLLGFLTVFGYRAVIRGGEPPAGAAATASCALCRSAHPKADLVERQIGDYKLLYFCRECIVRLASDAGVGN